MAEEVLEGLKVPPHSLEVEQAVLGAMMLDPEAVARVIQIIEQGDVFYKDAHRHIFNAIAELFDNSEPIDQISVVNHLKQKGLLDKVGGVYYITGLVESQHTSANIESHAKIVLDKYILRKLISTISSIATEAYEEREKVEKILDRAEERIFRISEESVKKPYKSLKSILYEAFEDIEELQKNETGITGVPTGLKDLDAKTNGFQSSELIIIAGRPSMGKTALALSIARNAAVDYNLPVGIFSLEMSDTQLAQRFLCAEARINIQSLRSGSLSGEQFKRLPHYANLLSQVPIFIDDSASLHILQLRAKARRMKAEKDIKLLLVDYLQLIQGPSSESRQQEIAAISRSLKALAKELEIPVVALSQLSRAPEARTDKRPQLSDLRESGAIEQDADLVTFVYRPYFYTKNEEDQGIAEINIAKQRNGPTGTVSVAFREEYARFENLERYGPEDLGAPF